MTAEGEEREHFVEIWAQLEAARGEAEEQKRQLATAQVSLVILQKACVGSCPLRGKKKRSFVMVPDSSSTAWVPPALQEKV